MRSRGRGRARPEGADRLAELSEPLRGSVPDVAEAGRRGGLGGESLGERVRVEGDDRERVAEVVVERPRDPPALSEVLALRLRPGRLRRERELSLPARHELPPGPRDLGERDREGGDREVAEQLVAEHDAGPRAAEELEARRDDEERERDRDREPPVARERRREEEDRERQHDADRRQPGCVVGADEERGDDDRDARPAVPEERQHPEGEREARGDGDVGGVAAARPAGRLPEERREEDRVRDREGEEHLEDEPPAARQHADSVGTVARAGVSPPGVHARGRVAPRGGRGPGGAPRSVGA